MPLVQTFGHLEFALKLKTFQKLREVDESPQSLCPSLNASLIFIEEMVSQVIKVHQKAVVRPTAATNDENCDMFTHIHIGCDEVFRMAV